MGPVPGLTKMRSIGPLAEGIKRAGGSIERVFRRADLPLQLLDEPERLILLSDQLHLLECAAREVGDAALPARLATTGGILSLGRYGQAVCDAPRLHQAIILAGELIGPFLQSQTNVRLKILGDVAQWSYTVADASDVGRQKNEILAVGYMLDLLRRFLGPRWIPIQATISGGSLPARTIAESELNCDLSLGNEASLRFSTSLLDAPNPGGGKAKLAIIESDIPEHVSFAVCIEHLIDLGLLDGRPSIGWLCRHLQMPQRTFQRRLQENRLNFDNLLRKQLAQKATHLLSQKVLSIAEIAQVLGYSDQSHFSRAFKSWTGLSPRAWQVKNTR